MYTVKSVFEKEAREMRAVYCETASLKHLRCRRQMLVIVTSPHKHASGGRCSR